ncbi:MAG: insulinase family protein [Rhodobacteraceae bacterium]|nr:insulinase family protein [Paracoccaceae bacterium]
MMRFLTLAAFLILAALPVRAGQNIQIVTSLGGVTAWLVEEHSIPFIALEIRFRGGTSLDLPGKEGATYMMAGLLEEGAGELDAEAFLKAREALAASFGFDAHGDAISVSAQFLTENRAEAQALLRLALLEPRFDSQALDRVRAQVISIIASDRKDPHSIASAEFDRQAFGDHPYGGPSTGTEDSVNRLGRDDMIAAYQNAMARDRVYVAAVGDITADQLAELLDDLLGGLPETGAALPPPAEVALSGGMTVIDYPSPQAVAVFGHAGIRRDDPDFFAAYVMNQVFGAGGLTSRLSEEVREKRGLTYGVYTYLANYDLADLFIGSVASSNDRIAEAVSVIRAEWQRMASAGVTGEELEAAKKYLTGAYPLRFDGNGRIAKILVGMQLDGLPPSYIDTRNDLVNAVTQDDVARVAARLLRSDDLRIVVVGQPVGLASSD